VKAKHQRLTLVLLALGAVGGASVLALSALEDEAAFFYAPSDVARGVPVGRAVRLGGMVEAGSLKRASDGVTQHFVVRDDGGRVPVTFAGIAPDLFKEGSGVVAEGAFVAGGAFVATNLLAKHDERYMPPQKGKVLHQAASLEK
jgi:cytochrome c-type biogenesis protein CcmE